MTTLTLRPNSTQYNDVDAPFTRSDAAYPSNAAINGVLSDGSDGTYAFAFVQGYATVGYPQPTLPAGAVIKSIQSLLRTQMPSGTPNGKMTVSVNHGASAGNVGVEIFRVDTSVPIGLSSWTPPAIASVSALNAIITQTLYYYTPGTAGQRIHVYEAYLIVTYVAKPRTAVTAPSGTLTDTNIPVITWANTLDADGGAQTNYAVRVFRRDVTLLPGFTPGQTTGLVAGTSPVIGGWTAGNGTTWTVPNALPDGDYVAYVAVAQTVNGVLHGSDWSLGGAFTIDVNLPGVPTLAAFREDDNGGIRLEVTDNPGDATTDWIELQRSEDDGETWVNARTPLGNGRLAPAAPSYAWDFEAPNTHRMRYRARAVHNYSGIPAVTVWAEVIDAWWTSRDRWLKHPGDANYNVKVDVWSYPDYDQEARQGVFMPLGGSAPIVATDTPGARVGTIAFLLEGDAARAAFDALYATGVPLLLQMLPEDERPDRWMILGAKRRAYMVDKLSVGESLDSMPWTEVERP